VTSASPAARAQWSLARVLRRRLLIAVAVLWTAAATLAVIAVRSEMNDVLDHALVSLAEHIPLDGSAPTMATTPSLFAAPINPNDVLHVLVRDANGKVLRRSGVPDEGRWALHVDPGLHTVDDWRVVTRRAPDDSVVVQVGELLRERRDALAESTAAMILPLLALLPLSALMIDLLLERSFKGVREAGEQWRARKEGDLSPLQANLPSEFDPLIVSINGLITRLQGTVRAERAFAASTAHELRTPLAAARAQAQRLLALLPDGETHERGLGLVRSLDRLSNTATKLLQLSRVESGIGLAREPVDLCQLAGLILDEFRHHAGTSHRLRLYVPPEPVVVQGDLDSLGIVLRNLIENALKHAPLASVEVRVEAPGQVIVSDDGPGVPPETLVNLSQPYERGSARAEGTGLGLSIVAKIVKQQRATLTMESPPPGKSFGFSVTVRMTPDDDEHDEPRKA
jgi:two-component system OmpR family sensor kinase